MLDYASRIDWIGFYKKHLNVTRVQNGEIIALCPFHNDNNPSFHAKKENGVWNCFGCGESGNAQTFLEKLLGVSNKEAITILKGEAGIKSETRPRKYTIDDYAAAKRLPVDFLKVLGIKNGKTGIIIPYMDESGAKISSRQRYGDTGSGPRFTWARGSKVSLYGLWRLPQIREAGYVILVEGESDSHTLWYHEYPALGVPGASVFQLAWVEFLRGLTIYIFQEPGVSGKTFVRRVSEALANNKFEGDVYTLHLIDAKDPSELHCKDPGKFKEHWQVVLDIAEKIDIDKMAKKAENVIPDAPVQLRQPPEWRFSVDGIFAINEKTGLPYCVCRTPILLSRRLKSLETGQEKVEVCYRRDGEWHTVVVNRSTLFQARTITQLADLGITVTSENAKMLVRFLQALEAENIDILSRADCVSQLGWHGNQFIPGYSEDLVIDVAPSTKNWLEAYHQEGTLEAWLETITPCRENSLFRFILSAAFAAPLLRIVGHRIFIIHNWGDTRSGKTAALKAALSVWGDPEGLMASFYATKVGLERLAGFFRDLPLGIDERQVANNDFTDNLIYMLSLGSSKVRGAKSGGLQSSQAWQTIILTTGEQPLSSTNSYSGVYTRTLELYGAPFDDEAMARKMHELISYGHAGPEFIRHIAKQKKSDIKVLHALLANDIGKEYKNHLSSHISSAAIVATADCLASDWLFGIDSDVAYQEALKMAYDVMQSLEDAKEADLVERAYEFIQGWILSNNEQFTNNFRTPRYGYTDIVGRYYVFPQILKEALEREGFSYRQVMSGLRNRGLLGVEPSEKRFTVTKRFGDVLAKFVQIELDRGVEDIEF